MAYGRMTHSQLDSPGTFFWSPALFRVPVLAADVATEEGHTRCNLGPRVGSRKWHFSAETCEELKL